MFNDYIRLMIGIILHKCERMGWKWRFHLLRSKPFPLSSMRIRNKSLWPMTINTNWVIFLMKYPHSCCDVHLASVSSQIRPTRIFTELKRLWSSNQRNFHLLPHLFQIHFQHSILEVDRETQERTPLFYGKAWNNKSEATFKSGFLISKVWGQKKTFKSLEI